VMAFLAAVGLILFLLVPGDAQRRMLLIFATNADDERSIAGLGSLEQTSIGDRASGGIGEATASSSARRHLIDRAFEMTLQNPFFGVGIGQFPTVIWTEGKALGVHEASLGTHNSYLQVSAETGIVAFGCYLSVLFLSISRFYRIYRQASRNPQLKELKAQSLCWFAASVCYAAVSMFHHIAFSSLLPLLGGACIAMELLSAPLLKASMPVPLPRGSSNPAFSMAGRQL
jgi:O-antigen ligase